MGDQGKRARQDGLRGRCEGNGLKRMDGLRLSDGHASKGGVVAREQRLRLKKGGGEGTPVGQSSGGIK